MNRLIATVTLLLTILLPRLLCAADPTPDIQTLERAAQQNDAYAQLNLGAAYDNGTGVTRDIDMALHWYQKAAEQGLAEAQFNLAHLLAENEMGASLAAEWMHKAAKQGMVEAEYLMGVILVEGIGVEIDENQARHWLQKAAAQGHEEAAHLLRRLE